MTTKNLRNRWVRRSLVGILPRSGGRGAALGRTLEKDLYRSRRVCELSRKARPTPRSVEVKMTCGRRIARDFVGSYDHGYVEPAPDSLDLGLAVASSAAFPTSTASCPRRPTCSPTTAMGRCTPA